MYIKKAEVRLSSFTKVYCRLKFEQDLFKISEKILQISFFVYITNIYKNRPRKNKNFVYLEETKYLRKNEMKIKKVQRRQVQ